ncbi:sigma-70 family RNA polymerase sigma factor [Bacillus albus]|uniref:sigma-70 family RNA polymerase sigma factor n=1 Tax=Bacillus albus TaxID=2026189 RepID=UPI002349BE8F|nr:sigma-70 family RNA polymerase sigma factor [Bacillus albus]MDC6156549.1 sigma-70 family RNA polymerase sigma factor [Bacillus albus]MDD8006026.1 sigma-70 family RNA polymerase sigma factor [Bacillus albus]
MKLVSKVDRDKLLEEIKEDTRRREEAAKKKRLERSVNRTYIEKLERQWIEFNGRTDKDRYNAFYEINEHGRIESVLDSIVKIVAAHFMKSRRGSTRLSKDDFESYLHETVWKGVEAYTGDGKYFLFELLGRSCRNKCIDLLRAEGLTKRSPKEKKLFHVATSYESYVENGGDSSTEFETETQIQLFIESTLTGLELQVAKFYILDGITNISQIGRLLGITDAKKAHRILDRVIKKLREKYTHV